MFIVFDLDGTLANCDHRTHHLQKKPKDWDSYFNECHLDEPYSEMISLFNLIKSTVGFLGFGNRLEIWTGRREDQRDKTIDWLIANGTYINENHPTPLRMRPTDIKTHDVELKGGFMKEFGRPDIVFEDRNSMVEFWREQGIRCCQVQEGNF